MELVGRAEGRCGGGDGGFELCLLTVISHGDGEVWQAASVDPLHFHFCPSCIPLNLDPCASCTPLSWVTRKYPLPVQ